LLHHPGMTRPVPACGWVGSASRPCGGPAFTLVELLTVIAIIAVLASVVIGLGQHASARGKVVRTKAELAALTTALETYRQQHGDFPRTNDATVMLQALVGKRGPNSESMSGPVLLDLALFTTGDSLDPVQSSAAKLIDPWGNAYAYGYYSVMGQRGYVLYSAGPDGVALAPEGLNQQYREAAANLDNVYASF